jgi:hypothetical protein
LLTIVDKCEAASIGLIHTSVREITLQQLDTTPRWNIGCRGLFTVTGLRVVTVEMYQGYQ